MTDGEYGQFATYFAASFPDVARFLPDETMQLWQRSLGGFELAELKSAVNAIVDGKVEFPKHPASQLPGLIAKLCRRDHARSCGHGPAPLEPHRPVAVGMMAFARQWMLDKIKACDAEYRQRDVDLPGLKAELDRRFPSKPEDERRVKCLDCLDQGTVEIWHEVSVHEAMAGVENFKRYRSLILCHCTAGHNRQCDPPGGTPLVRYDPNFEARWNGGSVTELLAWCGEYKQRRVKSMPGYESQFAEFSSSQ